MTQLDSPPPRMNAFGQAIGAATTWAGARRPERTAVQGRFCRLEPMDPARHGPGLHAAFALDPEGRNWTYLPYDRPQTEAETTALLRSVCMGDDPLFFTVIDQATGQAAGFCSYLRIAPEAGSIEVGWISFSPLLQRAPASTEAMALMMRRAFDLGYRRYEWKCDALNAPSRRAAARLGFQFEGVFRQAAVYKGRTRDTAWFSILDSEWPVISTAFDAWLDPGNFNADGQQRARLADVITSQKLA